MSVRIGVAPGRWSGAAQGGGELYTVTNPLGAKQVTVLETQGTQTCPDTSEQARED